MANKRTLKKQINLLCGSLMVECVATAHYKENIPQEDIDNIMISTLKLQDDMICRVSHVEPGIKASVFFKKLREEMAERAEEIINQLYAIA